MSKSVRSYRFNSKCLEEKRVYPEVKIIQCWSSSSQQQPLPEKDNLLTEFQTFLVDKRLKEDIGKQKKKIGINDSSDFQNTTSISHM